MLKRLVGRKIDEFGFLPVHWGCKKNVNWFIIFILGALPTLMSRLTFGSRDFYSSVVHQEHELPWSFHLMGSCLAQGRMRWALAWPKFKPQLGSCWLPGRGPALPHPARFFSSVEWEGQDQSLTKTAGVKGDGAPTRSKSSQAVATLVLVWVR